MMPSSTLRPRAVLRAALLAAALAGTASGLSGCIPLLFGGAAAGTATVVTDRRSSGTQLDDQTIAFKVENQVSKQLGNSENTRINATSYEGRVLITGDVPTEAAKSQATAAASQVEKVKSVANQLTVGPVESLGDRSNDSWLGSKVRTALLNAKYVPSGAITSTTDHSVVYLMGKVTQEEGNYAAAAVSGVGGVAKVVKLFTYISRDEAIRLSGNTTTSAPDSTSAAPATTAPIENGDDAAGGNDSMQAMPIK
ncbi:MAG TPA: BON domain-containing protein [Bordetella sp.]